MTVMIYHSLKARKAQQSRYLSRNNVDSGSGHEAAHCRGRNELYDPPQTKKTDAKDDEATYECDRRCYLWAVPFTGVRVVDVFNDLRDCERHNGHRTN